MKSAGLIVWERTGWWATRWRRWLSSRQVVVREVRSGAECLEQIAIAPRSVVAIELLPHSAAGMMHCLWQIERRFPHARSVVLANDPLAVCATTVLQAGARAFVTRSQQLPAVVRSIGRHLQAANRSTAMSDSVDPAGTSGEAVAATIDELFEDLAESGADRAIARAVEQLGAWLPDARPKNLRGT